MARAKTGAFYLTEQVQLTQQGVAVQGSISLASYVDVASRQGIAIEEVTFMNQGIEPSGQYTQSMEGIGSTGLRYSVGMQITDVNRGVQIISAGDRALIGSGALVGDTQGGLSHNSDLFPDNYGSVAMDEARIVVNSELFFTAETTNDFAGGNPVLASTVRLKCRIVSLTERDFMAITITGSAADN